MDDTKQLSYTGPLKECGFDGPVTGNNYVAHSGEAFEVDEKDAPELLRKYSKVLEEEDTKSKTRRPSGKSDDADTASA